MDGHCQFNKRFNFPYDIFRYVFYYSDYSWFHYIIYGYMGLFDIYNKQDRRNILSKEYMKEMLEMIDAKINHIEDITADNRAIIIKLVKQNNQIVEFLKQIDIEDVTDEYSDISFTKKEDSEKIKKVQELLEEFKSTSKDLKEFEEELKKHKDKLTPGQVGES
tara:strand:- start:239 stop:727 length:489 start_codon:yes stop_codon:yes gene_type:complete